MQNSVKFLTKNQEDISFSSPIHFRFIVLHTFDLRIAWLIQSIQRSLSSGVSAANSMLKPEKDRYGWLEREGEPTKCLPSDSYAHQPLPHPLAWSLGRRPRMEPGPRQDLHIWPDQAQHKDSEKANSYSRPKSSPCSLHLRDSAKIEVDPRRENTRNESKSPCRSRSGTARGRNDIHAIEVNLDLDDSPHSVAHFLPEDMWSQWAKIFDD